MILRSPTENETASGDIHVSLDSGTPCWNDAINRLWLR